MCSVIKSSLRLITWCMWGADLSRCWDRACCASAAGSAARSGLAGTTLPESSSCHRADPPASGQPRPPGTTTPQEKQNRSISNLRSISTDPRIRGSVHPVHYLYQVLIIPIFGNQSIGQIVWAGGMAGGGCHRACPPVFKLPRPPGMTPHDARLLHRVNVFESQSPHKAVNLGRSSYQNQF